MHRGWGNHDCSHDDDVSISCALGKNNIGVMIARELEFRLLVTGSTGHCHSLVPQTTNPNPNPKP